MRDKRRACCEFHTSNVLEMSNLNVFISSDYGWIPKKKSKARKKLFGEDDFKFFIFMSIFIFCLAGLVLIIVGLFTLLRLYKLRQYWF